MDISRARLGFSLLFLVLSIFGLVAAALNDAIFSRYVSNCMQSWRCVQLADTRKSPSQMPPFSRSTATPRPVPANPDVGRCAAATKRYVDWVPPAILAAAIAQVLVSVVLVTTTGSFESHAVFVYILSVIAVAGLVIASMHIPQTFHNVLSMSGVQWSAKPLNTDATQHCGDRAPRDIVLRWTSASCVAVFGIISLVSVPWMAKHAQKASKR